MFAKVLVRYESFDHRLPAKLGSCLSHSRGHLAIAINQHIDLAKKLIYNGRLNGTKNTEEAPMKNEQANWVVSAKADS